MLLARVSSKKKLFVALSSLALSHWASALPQYTAIDLGTLGGNESGAYAVNNAGQITGFAAVAPDSIPHAILYSGATLHDLGALDGGVSAGFGISASGVAAGFARTLPDANYRDRAAIFSNGTIQNLGTLVGLASVDGQESQAYGINDSGQVTGQSYTVAGAQRAFLYSNGVMHDLGTLADIENLLPSVFPGSVQSYGRGISNLGQVVGSSTTNDGAQHAFLYSNGAMHDLGVLPGFISGGSSGAHAINNLGQITGASDVVDGTTHAFLYSDGIMSDIGTLGGRDSNGFGINNRGVVVGVSSTAGNPGEQDQRAFIYQEGKMVDLNSLIPDKSG